SRRRCRPGRCRPGRYQPDGAGSRIAPVIVGLMDQRPRPRTAELLNLIPHPEGGWYRETWRAAPSWQPDGYPGPRSAATGIYFLLTPGEESAWHRVRSDEVWLWHSGGPLIMLAGGDGDAPSASPLAATLGAARADGQVPQHVVPAGHWQSARPAGGARSW